ncbi:hypothetical protein Lalb_Chr23g0275461 [Lupinus albus]|uniref:Uncharacterized protein n=1 Tax=Lupinus albus TaxID=3870 RepID=A0A6A4N9R9_LUPAL|nr:hypothetical protein Lalb_Chr23g0275461 [Lupinus albus]
MWFCQLSCRYNRSIIYFQTSVSHSFHRHFTDMASEGGKSFARRDRLREIESKVQTWWDERTFFGLNRGKVLWEFPISLYEWLFASWTCVFSF